VKFIPGLGVLVVLLVSGAVAQDLKLPPKIDDDVRVEYESQVLDLAGECEQAGLTDLAEKLRLAVTEVEAESIITNALTFNCPCKNQDPAGGCPSACNAPACICCAGHMRCCTYEHGSPNKRCRTKCVYDTWYCP